MGKGAICTGSRSSEEGGGGGGGGGEEEGMSMRAMEWVYCAIV